MTDDFLSPDDHTPAGGDAEEQLADDVGLDVSPDADDSAGIAREEHFGLTPPD